jgi:hypothetical protein
LLPDTALVETVAGVEDVGCDACCPTAAVASNTHGNAAVMETRIHGFIVYPIPMHCFEYAGC